MIGFRNNVCNELLVNWWDNDNNVIAFCRGNKGFVAFNNEPNDSVITVNTCLPRGDYCDVISGRKSGNRCTGRKIAVNERGKTVIRLKAQNVVALHSGVNSCCEKDLQKVYFFYSRLNCELNQCFQVRFIGKINPVSYTT